MSKKSKRKPAVKKKQTEVKKPSLFETHPVALSLGILVLLLFIFFQPVIFSNKTFLPPDRIASESFQPFFKSNLSNGVYPLWNPYIFGGMPSFASLTGVPYMDVPGTIFWGVLSLIGKVIPLSTFFRILFNYVLLGGFIYWFMRSRAMSHGVALVTMLAFVFMPQIIAYTAFNHNTKTATVAFLPLIFMLLVRLLDGRRLLDFSLLGLAVGMQLLRSHLQMCYYTQMLVGFYFLFWAVMAIRDKKPLSSVLKSGGLLAGALAMGLLISSVLNLSVIEYSHYSIRGGGASTGLGFDYATNWSFPPSELATFFIPSFMGFGGETYWGPMPFTDFPLYFGIVLFFLAGCALALKRTRLVWFLTLISVFSILVSFGKHFPVLYGPLFKFLPYFSKFRVPSMIHVLLHFSVVVLAGFGLNALIQKRREGDGRLPRALKNFIWGFAGVTVLLFLVLLFGKGAYLSWAVKSRAGAQAAYDKAIADGLRALVFVGFSVLIAVSAVRHKLSARLLPLLFAVLIIFDSWSVSFRFVDPKPKASSKAYFQETPDVTYLKQQQTPYRILPVADQRSPNWYAYHLIESSYGYHAAKIKRYQELLDAFDMPNGFIQKYLVRRDGGYAWKPPHQVPAQALAKDQAFLKLMNIRYVVTPYPLPDTLMNPVLSPRVRGQNFVLEYMDWLPRAWFPKNVTVMQGKETILKAMASGRFDPEETAILEEELPGPVAFSDSNRVTIISRGIHHMELEADVVTPGLLTFSEIYYPAGWRALVDGQETPIYRTDYVLRSIRLEPGRHDIRMEFKPKSFAVGLGISAGAFLLLIAGAFFGWKNEKKKEENEESNS